MFRCQGPTLRILFSVGPTGRSASAQFSQTLFVWGQGNTTLSDNRRHKLVRSDIESRVEYRYTVGNDPHASDVRYLGRVSLLDGDMRAVRNLEIQGGEGSGEIE